MALHQEGATVPFMARYRKEKTGNLDEVQIRSILEAHEEFTEINKRRAFVLGEIEQQGNLTEDLKKALTASWDLNEIEEIYRPFKRKRSPKPQSRAKVASNLWPIGFGLSPMVRSKRTHSRS